MCYHPEPNSYIRDNVKGVLHLTNYATKKIRTCYRCCACHLAAKNDFIAFKA